MKKILLFSILATSIMANAQLTTGTITYEEKMDMHVKLPKEAQQYKNMIPQFRSSKKALLFTPELSKYQAVVEEEEPTVINRGGGVRMEFRGDNNKNEIVHDLATNNKMELKEFMGRSFLIEDKGMDNMTWKIGQGQKEILGYICQEAVLYGDRDTLFAWFSPQIPIATGPRGYGKLPGMILQLESQSGFLTISALEISEEAPNKNEMKIKGSGKKYTREEFEAVMEEKRKEMEEQRGGGMVIKVRN